MGVRNPIIEASDTLKAVLFILVAACVAYVVYLVWAYGYVRPVTVGHSEPFDEYMRDEYVPELVRLLRELRAAPSDGRFAGAKAALAQFEAAYRRASGKGAGGPQADLLAAATPDDLSPAGSCALVYALLAFYDAIGRGDRQELSMLNKFVDHGRVHGFYAPGSNTTVDDPAPLQELRAAFNALRANVQGTAARLMDAPEGDAALDAAIVSVCTLDKVLNQYVEGGGGAHGGRDSVVRAYNLRKTGGRSAIIFRIYVGEYYTYVFRETVPRTWKGLGQQVRDTARGLQNYLASDAVRKAVERLPFRVAGMEGFEQPQPADGGTKHEKKGEEDEEPEEEVVEGFIGVLKSIAKTIVGLFKVVIALVKVITDPAAFVRFLLGLVIGMVVYILYILLLALSFLFVIPAFVLAVAYKALVTAVWTAVFAAIAAVYVVLWMLDICTGGMVLRLLRCENLPNAWHTRPGFARGNVYSRNLLCACRCASRYYPTGFMCKRMPDYEPAQCPQALIFNAYRGSLEPLRAQPYLHQYKPGPAYYVGQDDAARRRTWAKVFDDRQEFNGACREAMRPYDHITRRMCARLAADADFKARNPREHAQVLELCRATYCGGGASNGHAYCGSDADGQSPQPKPKDLIATAATHWIGLLLAATVAAVVCGLVRPRRLLPAVVSVPAAAAAAPFPAVVSVPAAAAAAPFPAA